MKLSKNNKTFAFHEHCKYTVGNFLVKNWLHACWCVLNEKIHLFVNKHPFSIKRCHRSHNAHWYKVSFIKLIHYFNAKMEKFSQDHQFDKNLDPQTLLQSLFSTDPQGGWEGLANLGSLLRLCPVGKCPQHLHWKTV